MHKNTGKQKSKKPIFCRFEAIIASRRCQSIVYTLQIARFFFAKKPQPLSAAETNHIQNIGLDQIFLYVPKAQER